MERADSPVETLNSEAVSISPAQPVQGKVVTITYRGMLTDSSDLVHAHIGYGQDKWVNVHNLPMTRDSSDAWMVTCAVQSSESMGILNVCFCNERGVWDNNGGRNWQLRI